MVLSFSCVVGCNFCNPKPRSLTTLLTRKPTNLKINTKRSNAHSLLTLKNNIKNPLALRHHEEQQSSVEELEEAGGYGYDYVYHYECYGDYNFAITTRSGTKVDFLCAKKSGGGQKYLMGGTGDAGTVNEIESLSGKIICLYFASLDSAKECSCVLKNVYITLKNKYPNNFEMVFVAIPPRRPIDDPDYWLEWNSTNNRLSNFVEVISTLPFPAVPFEEDWRANLYDLYLKPHREPPRAPHADNRALDKRLANLKMPIIDTSDPYKIKVLWTNAMGYLESYGPEYYPFTQNCISRVQKHFSELAKETSITALLGSSSGDYLIDRHFNKVPISDLENKDVFLYGYDEPNPFTQRLVDLYDEFKHRLGANNSFEVVFINFNECSHLYEEEFNHALSKMPWLALPFGHEKLWNLQYIMPIPIISYEYFSGKDLSVKLCIKTKGKSLLDPYGYQVFQRYGSEAYPFTRQAAFMLLKNQLEDSRLTFESYVYQANLLGLDFSSLVRNNKNSPTGDGMEKVLLSTVRERTKNIVLLFLNFVDREECDESVKSFIDAYSRQNNKSPCSSSFELIFVSVEPVLDEDEIYDSAYVPSFHKQFSGMPWFTFHRKLTVEEHRELNEKTIKFDFTGLSHFIAFGPAVGDLKIGLLPKSSLGNREFPFMNDAECAEDLRYGLALSNDWSQDNWCD